MRLIPAILGVLALALAPLAAAQPPVAAPSTYTPAQAVCYGAVGATPTCVDSTHPLPTTAAAAADAYLAAATIPATLNSAYVVPLGAGQGVAAFSVTGLTASGATLSISYSDDRGATYSTIRSVGTATVAGSATVTADGQFTVNAAGHTRIRLLVTTAGTGAITIASNTSIATKEVALSGQLPGFYAPPTVISDSPDAFGTLGGVAYTASTGSQPNGAGSTLVLMLANPAASGKRMYLPWEGRLFSCDLPTGNPAPYYASVSNPTVNLPTTAVTVTNRDPGGAGTVASIASAYYSATTTRADTSPTSQGPGNFFGAGMGDGKLPFDRVIEPGQTFVQFIPGKSYLVGATQTPMNCSITLGWTERAVGS